MLTVEAAMNRNPAAMEKVETESSLLGEQKKKRIAQVWYAAVYWTKLLMWDERLLNLSECYSKRH